MRIYVGNLASSTTADSVRYLFELYGAVTEVQLVFDDNTGRPHGFGLVIMPNRLEAETAIAQINGRTSEGRPLRLKEARPIRGQPRN